MSFFAVISLLGFLLAAEPENTGKPLPPVGEKQGEPTKQKGAGPETKNYTVPPSSTVTINVYPPANQKDPPPKEPEKWPPMWTIWITLAVTGLASIAALCTVGSIRGQAKSAKRQARAARRAIKLTAAQIDMMAQSERPWVIFKPQNPNLWGQIALFNNNIVPPFTVQWGIINVGRSPAFLKKLVPNIVIIPKTEVPPSPLLGDDSFNLILSPKIPPEDRHSANSSIPLTEDQFFGLHDGTLCVWLYGVAEYEDNMKSPHTTQFCCRWFVENGNWNYDPVGPEGWTKYT